MYVAHEKVLKEMKPGETREIAPRVFVTKEAPPKTERPKEKKDG